MKSRHKHIHKHNREMRAEECFVVCVGTGIAYRKEVMNMRGIAFVVFGRNAILAGLLVGIYGSSWAYMPTAPTYLAVEIPDDRIPTIDGDSTDWDWVPERFVLNAFEEIQIVDRHCPGFIDVFDPDIKLPTCEEFFEALPREFEFSAIVGWNERENRIYFVEEFWDNTQYVGGLPDIYAGLIMDADRGGGVQEYIMNFLSHELVVSPVSWVGHPPWTEGMWEFEIFYSPPTIQAARGAFEMAFTAFDTVSPDGIESSTVHNLEAGEVIGLSVVLVGPAPLAGVLMWDTAHKDLTGNTGAYHEIFENPGSFLLSSDLTPMQAQFGMDTWGRIKKEVNTHERGQP